MHRRQDGSAAQNKMQQGKTFSGKTPNGSAAQKKMPPWGKIFFEKTLTASSLPPHSQVVVPALFVQQHGDKFLATVTLRNVENGKMWTVEMNVLFPQNRPQVLLYYGWRDFATANDLGIGDRLAFVLVARSSFDVIILRRGGNPSLPVEKPKIRSQAEPIAARRETYPETKVYREPQLSCDIPTNGGEGSELKKTETLSTKETAKEICVAEVAPEVAPEAPDSSQNPTGMDSGLFEMMIQKFEEHGCIVCHIASLTKLGLLKPFGVDFHTAYNG